MRAASERELEFAFETLAHRGTDALLVAADPFFVRFAPIASKLWRRANRRGVPKANREVYSMPIKILAQLRC
jgi:hypothetical protein